MSTGSRKQLTFADSENSVAVSLIVAEIQEQNIYPIEQIDFQPGDTVIDIGAHVGVFAIYLAYKHPEIKIVCYEASPTNYANLCKNIEANGMTNIIAHHMAVTGDGREIELMETHEPFEETGFGQQQGNSGGCSAFSPKLKELNPGAPICTVSSTTLDAIVQQYGVCKLVKMDCEGAEHEIIKNSDCLQQGMVQNLFAEFHINDYLTNQGHSLEGSGELCRQLIPGRIRITGGGMAN